MSNSYPPYWEGQIGIPFTREEWKSILSCIQYTIHYSTTSADRCEMENNIMDRIEKNLGIE